MTTRLSLLTVLAALAIQACGPSEKDLAQSTLTDAQTAFAEHNFSRAKTLIDSVLYTFPRQFEVRREARTLLQTVNRTEQEENLAYLDSLIAVREKETQQYLKHFTIEDSKSDVPVLIHKHQTARMASERSYLRALTDTHGNFYLASHYTGSHPIGHVAVSVAMGQEYNTTDTVTNTALNHTFSNGEQTWEIVKYKNGADNGTAAFIARNFDQRLVVTFITPRRSTYKIYLTETDKKAIRDTYYLSLLLRETEQAKSQKTNVERALAKSKSNIIKN